MTKKIQTEKIRIAKTTEQLFVQFSDFNNFKSILPEEYISNLEINGDSCSFMIQNMIRMELQYVEKLPNSFIKVASSSTSPIPFSVNCLIEKIDAENSNLQVNIEMELNPMMAMMMKGKLDHLESQLNDKIKQMND